MRVGRSRGEPRGSVPVVGVLLLLALTVVAAAAVGAAALSLSSPSTPPSASFETGVDASSDTITLTHLGGDELDLSEIDLVVEIEGVRLRQQPPVPFFSASGFESGPTGPFNAASSDRWRGGETGTFTLASTNAPSLDAGDSVTIRVQTDEVTIATLSTTAS